MARTDNDTWDLASSVGATATMVAAARAVATRAPDAVIDDPFAEPLVRAVGVDFFTRLATGDLTPTDLDPDATGGAGNMDRFADGMAARTRFFDDFFSDAADAGVRQAVILASGLDSRAYRLPWPAGTVVFEIDQPGVITFKSDTLARLGAKPTADHRTVPVDLRDDWIGALEAAGFDRTEPSAWIAEGLFGYLPPEAQDRLLDQITELSPPGSRLAVEGVVSSPDADDEQIRERMQAVRDQWRQFGFDLDFSELVYTGERAEVAAYLGERGWRTDSITATALLEKCGLQSAEDSSANFADVRYVTAVK
ncbi:class I SAM-dependent methyltransferase [Mycolicibacterium monacense]|uniref:Putative S-adenosyl-L-methionine-dependent methyltransferase Mjls_1073 n=2 Tax=Mycobacteriaceae TaxID=1762 RepID=Y1073_MYCSJ|nr:class I SAM-dependent methyltransferase [Mycolicibacterium monacense]A3PVF3.1 RecName: Full=Putative S-adenosyl-L-methionine-dependent methyltransferase Mjls_1073 [Mycobacterium sp. JLS]MDA4101291.1 S-adenosyl-L-methionine-dependent methyltransferase [Mycolicibacterium monacense DSM 44395]OBB62637.1 SAM-dependent methyltransferase [Mycolicibacterium monacense]ORB20753.1 SAM-dependent methyltransferase [Mycolicibacterium monacense DSM 44395]QHP84882.1 class I SAM-dependent methyltransferase 